MPMSIRWLERLPPQGRRLLAWLGLALGYWAAAWLGLQLSIVQGNVSPVWPPTGLAIGALLLWGRWLWPGITLGAFAATAATGVSPWVALGVSLGNTLEALVAVTLLLRFNRFTDLPWRVRDVVSFLVLAVPLGALVSAALGTASLWLGGILTPEIVPRVAWTWWLGNLMGAMLLTPALVLWVRRPRLLHTTVRWAEGLALAVLLLVVDQAVFGDWPLEGGSHYPLAFLYLPPLIWAALRFGLHGATLVNLGVAVVAILGTALGSGPFVRGDMLESLLLLQTFLGLNAVTSLILAALMGERARTERALWASRTQLQAVQDTAVDGIITLDSRGIIRSFNPAAERLFGYRADQVLGRNINLLMFDRDARRHNHYIDRYLAGGEPRVVGLGREVEGRRRDGTPIPLELSVGEMWVNGERMFTGIARDIGPRRQLDAALRESEIRFRQLVEHLREVFWVLDRERGKVLYVSPAYEEVWGRPLDWLQDNPNGWLEAIHPQDLARVQRAAAEKLISGAFDEQYRIVRPNGEARWIHDRGFPIREPDGQVKRVVGIAEDITERVRTEARWRQAQAEIAHMGRLILVGEMSSELTHELKQPLSAISNYAGACLLLQRSGINPQRVEHALEQIVAQSGRAVEIIQRMKGFTRRTPFKAEPLGLENLVWEVVLFMDHEIQRLGVELTLKLPKSLPPVLADRVQLQQVLVNLMGNALEALESRTTPPRRLTVQAAHQDEMVTVEVIDNGPGIDPDKLQRLFQPFFTTKAEGTGLGLSISRSIIESHGGQLQGESNPSGGMTFRFTLPDSRAASKPAATARPAVL